MELHLLVDCFDKRCAFLSYSVACLLVRYAILLMHFSMARALGTSLHFTTTWVILRVSVIRGFLKAGLVETYALVSFCALSFIGVVSHELLFVVKKES